MVIRTVIILLFSGFYASSLFSQQWLSDEEQSWLKQQDAPIVLGCDPYAGMESFSINGQEEGVALDLTVLLSQALDVRVVPETSKSWNQVLSGLQDGSVDILFGANETDERRRIMEFTKPLYKNPYILLAKKSSDIIVVGDLEGKHLGFQAGDMIIDLFPELYPRIEYDRVVFPDQLEALEALDQGRIDGVITSGGTVIYDYLNKYPELKSVKIFSNISSDMTLSVLKNRDVLVHILNKFLIEYKAEIENIIGASRYLYNYKVMGLTTKEIEWIQKTGTAVVGVTNGYLPFELMDRGESKGICAALIRQISELTNICFQPVAGDFDSLLHRAEAGDIHVMNIARTPDRLERFYFTRPYSSERDVIYGKKDTPTVDDIYGLGESTVAVIEGYWHRELIEKNSFNTRIMDTSDLRHSMKALATGRADYLIENQSVMRYFIQEWEMYDIVEKGLTSFSSYMYFGIPISQPELASIMDKALALVDTDKAFQEGYNEIPHSNNRKRIIYQFVFIVTLILLLFLLGLFSFRQGRALAISRMAHERLKEREEMMYRDPMTGIFNRHYLYHKIEPYIDQKPFPQILIICDLNNLKTANDSWGHAAGDELLRNFASVLKNSFSTDDVLIRQGGDEFMILIFGKSPSYGEKAVFKMERMLTQSLITVDQGQTLSPTTAWGLAQRRGTGDISFQDLQIKADNRMYQHKRKMKGQPPEKASQMRSTGPGSH